MRIYIPKSAKTEAPGIDDLEKEGKANDDFVQANNEKQNTTADGNNSDDDKETPD
jgi:hypothetical protein